MISLRKSIIYELYYPSFCYEKMKITIILFFVITSSVFANNNAKAELFVLSKEENKINLALVISLEDGWHIYWKNSGDSGMPTEITWTLQEDMRVSEIIWPVPVIFESDGLVSYGYDNQVVFFYELSTNKLDPNQEIFCKINSLICKNVCIPFDTLISINLNNDSNKDVNHLLLKYSNNKNYLPIKNHSLKLSAKVYDAFIKLFIDNKDSDLPAFSKLHFLPYESGIFQNSTEQKFTLNNEEIVLTINFDSFKTKTPESIEGLLIFSSDKNNSEKMAYDISIKLSTN